MEKCPKCGKFSLDYNSHLNEATCLKAACDFKEAVVGWGLQSQEAEVGHPL
ncbi:MAG: hypothetical protein QMD08_07965 [Actinomycetota bacterium]|nr:hypothetical protein [Actinomycetota bacterium]